MQRSVCARKEPSGQIGLVLNLVSEHPATSDPRDVAASRRQDGIENRIFLDPLFRGHYPEDIVEFYRPYIPISASLPMAISSGFRGRSTISASITTSHI